jgi:plastocyanin domain-containing protein
MADGFRTKEFVVQMKIKNSDGIFKPQTGNESRPSLSIKKNMLYVIGTILLIVIGVVALKFNPTNALQASSTNSEEVQIVKLSVQGGQYVLEPSELKKGILTRMEADLSKMPGCSKSIVIPAFGVSKTFTSGSNMVEFTPDKAGTFNMACSMNMYHGTFTVLESDGTKSSNIGTSLNSEGMCSKGGCGG